MENDVITSEAYTRKEREKAKAALVKVKDLEAHRLQWGWHYVPTNKGMVLRRINTKH